MPVYRIEKTVVTYAYAPPGEMSEALADDFLNEALECGGTEEETPYFSEVKALPDKWRRSWLFYPGTNNLTGEEALGLP